MVESLPFSIVRIAKPLPVAVGFVELGYHRFHDVELGQVTFRPGLFQHCAHALPERL